MINNPRAEIAVSMVKQNPYISGSKIAEKAGCSRQNIYVTLNARGWFREKGRWVYNANRVRISEAKHYAFLDSDGNWIPIGRMSIGKAADKAAKEDPHFTKIAAIKYYIPFIDGMDVIKQLQENACFENEYADGWIDFIEYNSPEVIELSERLNKVLKAWLKKHHLESTFFIIEKEINYA